MTTLPPMTELLVAQGIQNTISGIDLSDQMGREAMLGLISTLERSLDRIRKAEWDAEDARWEAEQKDRENARIQEFGCGDFRQIVDGMIKGLTVLSQESDLHHALLTAKKDEVA